MSGIEAAASPLWDVIKGTFYFCCARADYFDDLANDLGSSEPEIERLKKMKEHVEERVQKETKPQTQQSYKVTDWLKRVDLFQEEAKEKIKEAKDEIRKKPLRWFCPKTCCSYNRVGKRVSEMRKQVAELIKDGEFDAVVERKPGDLVILMPVPKTVGLECKFEEIWRLIEDPSVGIIGLFGPGGVGKTTLLREIHNKICKKRDYVVIFVERSEQDPVKAAKETICKKFEISQEDWINKGEEINKAICSALRREKFALMLDDVGWQWLNRLSEEIGVPLDGNANGSKVIFTTRSKEVCHRMKAKRVEVERLPEGTALLLFQFCVGKETLDAHWQIPDLAVKVAAMCEGLPLLLTTVGRAMASKTKLRDWKRAIKKLKTQLSRFADVEASVFPVLKFSYDSLSTDTLRNCFLYFSLFPGIDVIKKEELIELWIAEGFLDKCSNRYEAREEGEDTLGSLKSVSLLENGKSEDFVKMYAEIQAMALWLAREEGKAEDKVLVQEETPQLSKWEKAERISLRGPSIESLRGTPSCHHLATLLLRATNLKMLPSEFFQFMPALRILDLSDNKGLIELPVGIGSLKSLVYLNLSGTRIEKLPGEVKNLKKLQFLILDRTTLQLTIPKGVISSLSSLQAFRRVFDLSLTLNSPLDSEVELLKELESLKQIDEIGILLSYESFANKVMDTHNLRSSIKQLQLVQGTDSLPKLSLRGMKHLERLELLKCSSLTELEIVKENNQQEPEINAFPDFRVRKMQEIFPNLRIVRICNCPIKNVTCLVNVPSLQSLKISDCKEIVEVVSETVVSETFAQDLFRNLVKLSLKRLPQLKSIYCKALQFPSLEKLFVIDCPNLRSLPFDSNSAKKLRRVKGSGSWWSEAAGTNHAFSSKFRDEAHVMELVKADEFYNPYAAPYCNIYTPEEDPNACVIQ